MRKKAEKTRGAGTLTESEFWSRIRSLLRNNSRFWKPISEARKLARRPYTGNNPRQKWEYKCDRCKKYFIETEIHVDHIIEAGSLRCAEDLPGFVERLFCEVDNLRVLCKPCHKSRNYDNF